MLTKVTVFGAQNRTATFSLSEPAEGYIVNSIDGLDPVNAAMVSSPFGGMDGEQYQASRRERRNIVIKLDLDPLYRSAQQLRSYLYTFFMPKQEVKLRFYTDEVEYVEISGRVESFSAPLFAKEPKATISIICFKPDFISPTPVLLEGEGTSLLEFDYLGSVDTGFVLRAPIRYNGSSKVTILNRLYGQPERIFEFSAPLSVGDTLEISTVIGAKGAWRVRGNTRTSVLYGVSPKADWLRLESGENRIGFLAEGDPPFTIEYQNRYGGL